MTSYSFATKLQWFVSEPDTIELICADCGATITADKKHRTTTKYCDSCLYQRNLEQCRNNTRKTEQDPEAIFFHNPGIDLAYAVIAQAIEDARNGNDEARKFLRADDGAILYLKCAGIEVTDKMRGRLFWIGKKRDKDTLERRANAG